MIYNDAIWYSYFLGTSFCRRNTHIEVLTLSNSNLQKVLRPIFSRWKAQGLLTTDPIPYHVNGGTVPYKAIFVGGYPLT